MKKHLLPLFVGFVLACLSGSVSAQPSKDAKSDSSERKPKVIVNATEANPEYAYDTWDKNVKPVKGGLLIDAPSGKGGFGANNLKVDVEGLKEVEVVIYTGRDNAMQTMNLSLVDVYGAEILWDVRIDQIAPVQGVVFRLKLANGKLTLKGKRTSFDFTEIKGYQIKGDWNEQPVQFTLVGVRARF